MPIRTYDRAFGGKPGSAAEALAQMRAQYGAKKGTSVFYATINKRKKRPAGSLAQALQDRSSG